MNKIVLDASKHRVKNNYYIGKYIRNNKHYFDYIMSGYTSEYTAYRGLYICIIVLDYLK